MRLVANRKLAFLLSLVLFLGLVALLSGCSTTETGESELPWNTPQSWEGAPMIPGFDGNM